MGSAKGKLIIYKSLLFLFLAVLGISLLCASQNQSWYLFFWELRYGFADNKAFGNKFVWLSLILVFYIIWSLLAVKVRLNWKIRIGKWTWNYYSDKYLNKIFIPIVCGIIVFLAFIFIQVNSDLRNVKSGNLWKGSSTVGHSFGEIDGKTYTGSLEAFQNNYQKGLRVFEVDLDITSDNKVVLRHDWGQKIQEGVSEDNVPTEERFLSIPILDKYTPISFEGLCMLMKNYPDIWIVTDSKYDTPEMIDKQFTIMKETAYDAGVPEVLDRFIIQIYNEEMYEVLETVYPFKSYIFTMYKRWDSGIDEYVNICRWSREHGVNAITIGQQVVNKEIMDISSRYGLDIYVHTVNDIDKAKELLADGARGIYTDRLAPAELEEDSVKN